MISSALKEFLEAEREVCNGLVAAVKHQHPYLDLDGFQQFLRNELDSIGQKFGEPGTQFSRFAYAAFRHGLELSAAGWLNQPETHHAVSRLWFEVIPACLPIIMQRPEKWLASFANVIATLQSANVTYPERWLDNLVRVVPVCRSDKELEQAGLIAAWMAGMANYRNVAVCELQNLDEKLFTAITGGTNRAALLERLGSNRWVAIDGKQKEPLNIQKRVGAALWLEGEFQLPPEICTLNDVFFVRSSEQIWSLHIDCYGHVLSLLPTNEVHDLNLSFDQCDHLQVLPKYGEALNLKLNDLEVISSSAETGDTLAVTSKDSFAVVLLNR